MAELTQLQTETLRLIVDGKVAMIRAGTAAFRIRGGPPGLVGRLISMGLARWPKGPVGEQTCEPTEAGRAALASVEGR